MRRGTWVIGLLLATLFARSAFAASLDFCTMSSGKPALASLSQDEHVHMDHAQPDHTTMQHDVGEAQKQYGCCTADCMMSACLSMLTPVTHLSSCIRVRSVVIFFRALAIPQPPYFPPLRPPIA